MAVRPRTRTEVLAHLAASRAAYDAAHADTPPKPERVFRHAPDPAERRHGVGGNGAPPTPGERLAKLGDAMYGSSWKSELAAETGVAVRTIHRLVGGESPLRPEMVARLKAAMNRHAARVERAMVALEASLEPQDEI